MPSYRNFPRIDTMELKTQIFKKLGRQKAEKYFYNLKRLLSLKLSKLEFDKLCCNTIGKENVALHNLLIRSILSNACLAHSPPSKQTVTGQSRNTRTSSGQFGGVFPRSLQKGKTTSNRDDGLSDHPSPLGRHGKTAAGNLLEVTNSCDLPRSREQQSAPEMISIGSKAFLEVASVEEGEEVEQVRCSPSVQSRSPVRPPLGVTLNVGGNSRKALRGGAGGSFRLSMVDASVVCSSSLELPDTGCLKTRLEHKLELEGLGVSLDCVNLLNNGLDVYLKRLIKPCMELARVRCNSIRRSLVNNKPFYSTNGVLQEGDNHQSTQPYSASFRDFKVAMELNPCLLGADWPVQLEKICLHSAEE